MGRLRRRSWINDLNIAVAADPFDTPVKRLFAEYERLMIACHRPSRWISTLLSRAKNRQAESESAMPNSAYIRFLPRPDNPAAPGPSRGIMVNNSGACGPQAAARLAPPRRDGG